MRLEWIPIVRQRKWSEFETIARENPSWTLYETVRELEMGMPGKDDRYRLRQVLKVLNEMGYHEETEEAEHTPPRPNFRAVDPYRLGVVSEYNFMGVQFLYLMYRKESNWVTVAVESTCHSDECAATCQLSPHKNLPANRANGFKSGPPQGYDHVVEMPYPLVASRILRVLEEKRGEQSDRALQGFVYKDLRKMSAHAYHPVDRWHLPEFSEEELRFGWRQCPVAQNWLLYCPESLPSMPAVARVTRDLKLSVEARAKERFRLLQQDWEQIFELGPVEEFEKRCKDTAWLLAAKDEWEAAMLLAGVARSIGKLRDQSPFFLGLLQQTAKVIPSYFSESLRSEEIVKAA